MQKSPQNYNIQQVIESVLLIWKTNKCFKSVLSQMPAGPAEVREVNHADELIHFNASDPT